MPGYTPDLVPPNAQPGLCYARVEIPAQYATQTETVITEDGYNTAQVRQPQIRSTQKQIVSKEASVRYEVSQPRYNTVSEQVLVRPAYDKLSVVAPQFNTVTETIATSAPRLVWKRGNPAQLRSQGYKIHSTADAGRRGHGYRSTHHYGQSGGNQCGTLCEIWCLVEEPGDSVTFQRKVMTTPPQVTRTSVPPKYETISKQVVVDPGGVREIPVPAEYRTMTVEEVVDPGGQMIVPVAPKYGNVEKKVLVAPERYEWRQVQCTPSAQPARAAAPIVHRPQYVTPAPISAPIQQPHNMKMAPVVCNSNQVRHTANRSCSSRGHSTPRHRSGYRH